MTAGFAATKVNKALSACASASRRQTTGKTPGLGGSGVLTYR